MEVVFVRHTSVDVPKGTCYGWTDVPLNKTFEEEAEQTRRELLAYSFDVVYSSPLTRAKRLADYCGYESPVVDERVKEMNMGDWEMCRFDEIDDDNLQKWYDDYMNVPTTNGESFPMLYARVAAFLDELKAKPYNSVAVFAHGGVLMCAGIYGGLFTAADCFKHLVPFGGTERIEI